MFFSLFIYCTLRSTTYKPDSVSDPWLQKVAAKFTVNMISGDRCFTC